MSIADRARDALQEHFGFVDFREGQREVIEAVLAGQNAVVIMPTGGGKSLCYQLPAMMIDGVTLVVSPLIALMKDQVDQLSSRSIPTTFINSSLSYSETNKRMSELRRGVYKLVYVAPERFRSQLFMNAIADVKVHLFAVDEAHCISHWGHDFRPDYLRLRQAAAKLGNPQIIALTATATPHVRADITEQLGLTDPYVAVAGFDRPNLALRISHVATEKEKLEIIKRLLGKPGGAGIIYAATRKTVEKVTAKLKMAGFMVEAYHAGMDERDRTRAQDGFMGGKWQAIVATNSFGMGIDKRDIRFVVHYHLPGSIEEYYQEIGRAGRDGEPSQCVLLFNYADTRFHEFFIEGSHPPPDLIKRVYHEIVLLSKEAGIDRIEMSAREMAARIGIKNDMSVYSALAVLERAGHIERGRGNDRTIIASLKISIDNALASIPEDSQEGIVLRELIFNHNLTERENIELDLNPLASQLNLTDGQIRRAISLLSAREVVSNRSAYLGRGIRLLDEAAAGELRIDTRELAARAAAERWKLRRMIDFAYHKGCLRRFILNHFGDNKKIEFCGSCSRCAPEATIDAAGQDRKRAAATAGTLTIAAAKGSPRSALLPAATELDRFIIEQAPSGDELRADLRRRAELKRALQSSTVSDVPPSRGAARELSEAEVIVVKKVLSCVARLNGRFGKGTIAAVLRGSNSKQVIEHRLDKLSTYGLLRDMTQDEITQRVKTLIEAGCILVGRGAYPTVTLSDFGREVMAGRAEVMLKLA